MLQEHQLLYGKAADCRGLALVVWLVCGAKKVVKGADSVDQNLGCKEKRKLVRTGKDSDDGNQRQWPVAQQSREAEVANSGR